MGNKGSYVIKVFPKAIIIIALPGMPISGFSNSAVNKDMMSKI